jgi:hypothetical protein
MNCAKPICQKWIFFPEKKVSYAKKVGRYGVKDRLFVPKKKSIFIFIHYSISIFFKFFEKKGNMWGDTG